MMDELLNALLGGQGQSQDGDDPLADLMGSVMGGASGADAGSAGGLLEALIGGGGMQGAGGLGDILGSVLGGGGPSTQAGGLMDPVAQSLAEKLGLPPEIARAVVAFAFSKLMAALTGAASGTGTADSSAPDPREAFDLDHLLGQTGSDESLGAAYLKSTGMADELAEQTGLDRDTAAASLQETFTIFSSQIAGGQASTAQGKSAEGGPDDLLESW
jgi:hypothetical protein